MSAPVLRRRLLGAESPLNCAMVSDGAFNRASLGGGEAQAELRDALGLDPEAKAGLDRVFATSPGKLRDEIASIVEGWAARVSPALADRSMTLIERDVTPKEGLLRVTGARDALRVFTNGVDIDPTGWATEVVVIPTVALRPFIAPVSGAPPCCSWSRSPTRRWTPSPVVRRCGWSRRRPPSVMSCGCGSCTSSAAASERPRSLPTSSAWTARASTTTSESFDRPGWSRSSPRTPSPGGMHGAPTALIVRLLRWRPTSARARWASAPTHASTRSAMSVIQRLGLPSPASISK